MLLEDIPVWWEFLSKFAHLFQSFYYDVRVGGQVLPEGYAEPAMARSWWQTTAKRIDVVAETKDEVWLIEVSAGPGLRAVGQIMTYWTLWALDPKIPKTVKKVLVVDRIDQDLEFACYASGVQVFQV